MQEPVQVPLRDIHLPADPGWWPPAPGWWLLAGFILVSALLLRWWLQRRRRISLSAARLAHRELERLREEYRHGGDNAQVIRELSILLRRFSVSTSPRRDSAGLTGADWLEFLDRDLDDRPFSRGPGRILADAPYRPRIEVAEIEPLFALCARRIDTTGGARRGRRQ